MKIRVVRAFHEGVGCPPHKIGEVMEVDEKRATELITANWCVAVEEEKAEKPKARTRTKKA